VRQSPRLVPFQKFPKRQKLRPLALLSHVPVARVRATTPSPAAREWAHDLRLPAQMLLALERPAPAVRDPATTLTPNALPVIPVPVAPVRWALAQADLVVPALVPVVQAHVLVALVLVPAAPAVLAADSLVPVVLQVLAQVAALVVPVVQVPVLVLVVRPSQVAPVVAATVVAVAVLLEPSVREVAGTVRRASLVKRSAKRWTTWPHQTWVASLFRAETARPLCVYLVVHPLLTSLIALMPKPQHLLLRSST
jgi:hypothetical protein